MMITLFSTALGAEVTFQRLGFGTEADNGVFSEDIDGDGTRALIALGRGRISIYRPPAGEKSPYSEQAEVLTTGASAYFACVADVLPAKGKEILLLTPAGVSCFAHEDARRHSAKPQSLIACETLLGAPAVRGALAAARGADVDILPWNFAFDADGDGRDDLLIPTAQGIAVYLQKAPGQFAPPITLPVFPGMRLAVIAGPHGDDITPHTLSARSTLPLRFELNLPKIESRDINKDGKPDIICGDVYFAQKAAGGFETVPGPVPPEALPEATRGPMDIDGDGRLDRLLVEHDLSDPFNLITRVRVFMAQKDGKLPERPIRTIVGQNILVYGDFPVHDFLKDGTLGFAMLKVDPAPFPHRYKPGQVEGDLDFYLFDRDKNLYPRSPVYRKPIRMDFKIDPAQAMNVSLGEHYLGNAIRLGGDYNADGRPDLLVWEKSDELAIYFNTGRRNELFSRRPDIWLDKIPAFGRLGIADLNGDGASDIILYGPKDRPNKVVAVYISRLR